MASVQERLQAELKAMIADGRIRPGERLLEVKVADAFSVSRSPARATLKALAAEGRIRKAEGRGYRVAGPATAAATGRLATLDPVSIQPAPLWERVYADVELHLARQILFRTVRLTEERLAAHFDVSRTVARDVLARMEAVGLVGKDRLGRWVAERVTPERIRHLYELRWLLEPAALRQAAARLPAEWLREVRQAMQSTLHRMPASDGPEMDRLEHLLHVQMMEHCPNRELIRALGPTRLLLVLNRYLIELSIDPPAHDVTDTLKEHLDVVDRLLARDWEGAAGALERHLRRSCGLWQVRHRQAARAAGAAPLAPYLVAGDRA